MLLSSDATTNKSRFSTKMDLKRAMLLVCSEADDIWKKTKQKKKQATIGGSKRRIKSIFLRTRTGYCLFQIEEYC